jgi:pescadillo protein
MFLLPISRYAVGANLPPHLSPWVDDEEEGYKPAYAEEIERLKNGESVAHTESFCPDANREVPVEKIGEVVNEEEDEEEVSEEEEESDEEAPAAKERQERKRKKEEAEANALAKTMMNRKAAHLYGRMQHGIARKKAKVDSLHERRRELEGKESGKSVLKQKVERLKKERKSIESAYSDTGGSMKKHKKR